MSPALSRRAALAGALATAPAVAAAALPAAIGGDPNALVTAARERLDLHFAGIKRAASELYGCNVSVDIFFDPEEIGADRHLFELEKKFEQAKAIYEAIDAVEEDYKE